MNIRSLTGEKLGVFILLCLGCFTISFNVAAVSAAIPTISYDLRLADFKVAAVIPYYLVPYGMGALLYAPVTRYISYRTVFVALLAIYGISCYICAGADSLGVLLGGRVAMGVSASGAIPLGLMLIGDFFEQKIRGRLVGIFFSHAFIAAIAGLIVGGIFSWRIIFYVPAVLSCLLLGLFFFYRSKILDEKHIGHINYLKVLRKKEILNVFVFIFMISFLYHGVHKWYGIYLSQVYLFDQLTINLFVMLTVIAGMMGQLCGGLLSDKKGRYFTTELGVVGLSLGIMLLGGQYSKVVLGLILAMISVFWTVGHNGVSTVLTDFADEDRPVIASLNSSVRFIGGGLGFYVSSLFIERSFSFTFLGFGILILILSLRLKKYIPQICIK